MSKAVSGPVACRFCGALATGYGKGTGHVSRPPSGQIPQCDADVCWDKTYEIIRIYPSRDWWILKQPDTLF